MNKNRNELFRPFLHFLTPFQCFSEQLKTASFMSCVKLSMNSPWRRQSTPDCQGHFNQSCNGLLYAMKLIFTLYIMRKQDVIKWSAERIRYLYPKMKWYTYFNQMSPLTIKKKVSQYLHQKRSNPRLNDLKVCYLTRRGIKELVFNLRPGALLVDAFKGLSEFPR